MQDRPSTARQREKEAAGGCEETPNTLRSINQNRKVTNSAAAVSTA